MDDEDVEMEDVMSAIAAAAACHHNLVANNLNIRTAIQSRVGGERPGGTNRIGRPNYEESEWGRMYRSQRDQLQNVNSEEHRTFRRRFRVPYPVFDLLLKETERWLSSINQLSATDCTGRVGPPVYLKLLGVLRILGRGTCADGITELSHMSEDIVLTFFHKFCKWVRSDLYPKFVHPPRTPEEIASAMGPYIAVGMNGCLGSTDAVHEKWDMCPADQKCIHTGKEGFPTIVYNVTSTHDGAATHVSSGSYGSCNDKTLIRFDEFIADLRTLGTYKECEYELFTAPGVTETVKGLYVVVDGGYHRWRSTMSASRFRTDPDFVRWREQLESVRKDIECFFGVLKGRFRVLKMPILFHKKTEIDDMFFTCVTLHNMIHKFDGRDVWEAGVRWGGVDGNFEDDDHPRWSRPEVRRPNGTWSPVQDGEDFSSMGSASFGQNNVPVPPAAAENPDIDISEWVELAVETQSGFNALQDKLVRHYRIRKDAGTIHWMRSHGRSS